TQFALREPLGDAAGGPDGGGDLLGGQPGDTDEQHHHHHERSGKQSAHQCEGGLIVFHREHQVDLESRDVTLRGGADDQRVVGGTVTLVDGGELVGHLVLGHVV